MAAYSVSLYWDFSHTVVQQILFIYKQTNPTQTLKIPCETTKGQMFHMNSLHKTKTMKTATLVFHTFVASVLHKLSVYPDTMIKLLHSYTLGLFTL